MRNRPSLIRALLPMAALLSVLVLAACAGGATVSSPAERSPDAPPADETAAPTVPTADITEQGLAALVASAAAEAGVDIDEVRVVTAEQVTWSDGSLGCPEPGQFYTQALVPGFRVVLEIGGDELNFHAAQGGEFRFCENPQPPAEGR